MQSCIHASAYTTNIPLTHGHLGRSTCPKNLPREHDVIFLAQMTYVSFARVQIWRRSRWGLGLGGAQSRESEIMAVAHSFLFSGSAGGLYESVQLTKTTEYGYHIQMSRD